MWTINASPVGSLTEATLKRNYAEVRKRLGVGLPIARPVPVATAPPPKRDLEEKICEELQIDNRTLEEKICEVLSRCGPIVPVNERINKMDPSPKGSLPSFRKVAKAVTSVFRVTFDDLTGPNKTPVMVVPRQVTMAIAVIAFKLSLPEVGRRLKRDHTTVLCGVTKYRALVERLIGGSNGLENSGT